MGSCGAIDPSVGGLVWVRRRNGSWWPGRILGVDELPESCLVSPRSGTPVKLLGREDASVDWYNLEKSKRVKAFRCGEYDECIEKAKAAAANSSKKVVKYARREDAILHALELEHARNTQDFPDFCSKVDEPSGEECEALKESPTTSHHDEETEHAAENLSNSEENSNSEQELSHSGVSFEEPNHISDSKDQSVRGRHRRTPNDSEDDGMEGIKRMKGLEDLGMGVVSSFKRKRSQMSHVHEFLKRKSRRRQLTKVLESTAMVTVPVMCEQLGSPEGSLLPGVSECKVSGLESNESKMSVSVAINNNSDSTGFSGENGNSLNASEHACDASLVDCKQKKNEISNALGLPENDSSERLFDVPFVGEDIHRAEFSSKYISCASQKPQMCGGAQSSQSSLVETLSLVHEEFYESGSISSGAANINNNNIRHTIEKGSSDWQSKGKRNSRHKSKNRKHYSKIPAYVDDEYNEHLTGTEPPDPYSLGSGKKVNFNAKDGSLNSNNFSHRESQRSNPYRQSRSTINPKYQTSDLPLRNYGGESCLYDVELEVKTSYRSQHVPYISLMSKLNGRPIIGHPVTVEALENGFCDLIIAGYERYSSNRQLNDDMVENMSALQCVDMVYEARSNRVGKIKSSSPSKSAKIWKNGPLSKKIRKLSSLNGSHKRSVEERKPVMEKLKGPSVACVPIKVVFCRINAALNSSSSNRPGHLVMPQNHL